MVDMVESVVGVVDVESTGVFLAACQNWTSFSQDSQLFLRSCLMSLGNSLHRSEGMASLGLRPFRRAL